MNYGALSTEKLNKELKKLQAWLRWGETVADTPDLWKVDIKQRITEVEAELKQRVKEPIWI